MKYFLFSMFIFCLNVFTAQELKTGMYTSEDGNYSVNIEHTGNTIKLVEPNRNNTYVKANDGNYYNEDSKYQSYYVRVPDNQTFYTGKSNSPNSEFKFIFSGNADEAIASGLENCTLYNKYNEKLENDSDNAQAWTFCAAAALAQCTYNEHGAKQYIQAAAYALKSISSDGVCPCTDVISSVDWNAVTIE